MKVARDLNPGSVPFFEQMFVPEVRLVFLQRLGLNARAEVVKFFGPFVSRV